jgi:hypothetical protein
MLAESRSIAGGLDERYRDGARRVTMPPMTRLIARLILAMLLLPVTGALWVFGFALMVSVRTPPSLFAIGALYGVVYAFVGAYWVLLWRGAVRWTRGRIVNTIAAGAASIVVGVGIGIGASWVVRVAPQELCMLLAGGTVPILWVLATVLIWRETPAERVARLARLGRDAVVCPICGYNLAGLREARCPECGTQFTLDKLLATQPELDHSLVDAASNE